MATITGKLKVPPFLKNLNMKTANEPLIYKIIINIFLKILHVYSDPQYSRHKGKWQ